MESKLIYGLKCPFTEEVHYIGKTTKGMLRPLSHLSKSHNEKVMDWVNNLKELGHSPKIEILERVSSLDILEDREKYWIQKHFNKGSMLLNTFLVSPELVNSKLDTVLKKQPYGDISHISNFIKEKRRLANVTQPRFADIAGVSLKVLRKLEQNKTNLQLDGLLQILSMFGHTLEVKKIN